MGWRDRLQQASFRGVRFEVESRSLQGGRRVVEHVYPQRDGSGAEDMGRQAHGLSVKGWLFGTDYDRNRDELMAALERAGVGEYVDCWGKHHPVVVTGWTMSESLAQGGMATFDITFREQSADGHRVETDTAHAVTTAASTARSAATTSFLRLFTVSGNNAWLSDAVAVVQVLATVVGATIAGVTAITDSAKALVALVPSPVTLAQGLLDLFSTIGSSTSSADQWTTSLALTRFGDAIPAARARGGLYGSEEATTPWVPLASLAQVRAAVTAATTGASLSVADRLAVNRAVLVAVVGDLALSQMAEAASATSYDSAAAALAARDTLSARIDARLDSADDTLFGPLLALQSASVSDLTGRAAQLARSVHYTPATTQPALVLAHRLYGDASQGASIVARNGLRHPGMVPGGTTLSVLSPESTTESTS